MIRSLKQSLARHANNYRGWRTHRKIVVIESDDWGSICMPSAEIKQKLIKQNYRVNKCPYTSFDALASEKDLNELYSVLFEIKDDLGNHPVITANTVMTNPDFEKIRESDFKSYHYEIFTETLKKYPEHQNSFELWGKGIADHLFYPQFHGREHLNIKLWLEVLQDQESGYRAVFNDSICYLGSHRDDGGGNRSIRAAYDADKIEDLKDQEASIQEVLELFKNIFGYRSRSFIAPNFIYHPKLNQTLFDNGVQYIQGMKYQKLPMLEDKKRTMNRRYQGQKNDVGQYNLVRNCVFEPSQFPENFDSVGECLKGIRNAFLWRKPAIITAHRLNFIGYIVPENRERNLKLFRELLKSILVQWPDVEFMTSTQLGDLIAEGEN